jgi:hypothetical protein
MTEDADRHGGLLAPFRDPVVGRRLQALTVAGLAVRMLLLPIGISSDTLAVYWRSHLISAHGQVFEEYLVNMGSHVVHALWLLVAQPFLGPADEVWTHPWWWEDNAAIPAHMQEFLSQDAAARSITLLKLPYAAAELFAGLLLLALVWHGAKRVTARADRAVAVWTFWMFSPAALYATYLFARYEAFPVLAILLALYLAERERDWSAAIVLGLGVTLRTFPLLLIPVFALVLRRGVRAQAIWAAVAIVPYALSVVFMRVFVGKAGELQNFSEYRFGDNFFVFALRPPGDGPAILLLPTFLLVLGVYLLGRDHGWWGAGPVDRGELWRWTAIALLGVFVLSQFSAHYLMWLTPAIGLVIGRRNPAGVGWLHLGQIAGAFASIFVLYGGIVYSGVLGGLGQQARWALPASPPIADPARTQLLGDLAWSVYVAATLAIMVPLVLETVRRRADAGGLPATQG